MPIQTKFIETHGLWEAFDTDYPSVVAFGKSEHDATKAFNVELAYASCTEEEYLDNHLDDEESLEYFNRYIAGDR